MGGPRSTFARTLRRLRTPVLPSRRVVRAHRPQARQEEEAAEGRTFLAVWWPTLLGVVVAFIAPSIWGSLHAAGNDTATWFIFPYAMIAGHTEFGISAELASNLKQIMVPLQFPLEGLVMTWGLARGQSVLRAFSQVLFLHALGVFVAWLLSQPLFG